MKTIKLPAADLARVTGGVGSLADKLQALQLPSVPNAGDLSTFRSIK